MEFLREVVDDSSIPPSSKHTSIDIPPLQSTRGTLRVHDEAYQVHSLTVDVCTRSNRNGTNDDIPGDGEGGSVPDVHRHRERPHVTLVLCRQAQRRVGAARGRPVRRAVRVALAPVPAPAEHARRRRRQAPQHARQPACRRSNEGRGRRSRARLHGQDRPRDADSRLHCSSQPSLHRWFPSA